MTNAMLLAMIMIKKIKSVNDKIHRYCAQIELQFRAKLKSSAGNSFKTPVKEGVVPFFLCFSQSLIFSNKLSVNHTV